MSASRQEGTLTVLTCDISLARAGFGKTLEKAHKPQLLQAFSGEIPPPPCNNSPSTRDSVERAETIPAAAREQHCCKRETSKTKTTTACHSSHPAGSPALVLAQHPDSVPSLPGILHCRPRTPPPLRARRGSCLLLPSGTVHAHGGVFVAAVGDGVGGAAITSDIFGAAITAAVAIVTVGLGIHCLWVHQGDPQPHRHVRQLLRYLGGEGAGGNALAERSVAMGGVGVGLAGPMHAKSFAFQEGFGPGIEMILCSSFVVHLRDKKRAGTKRT